MAGAEIANLKGTWKNGVLVLEDLNGVDIVTIGGSSTGMRAIPAGFGSVVTTSMTLSQDDVGTVHYSLGTTTITYTLPYAGSTCAHASFTIINAGSTAGVDIIVKAAVTTEIMVGCGTASDAVVTQITNTLATAQPGDACHINAGGSTSNIWYLTSLVGTWASTN